MNLLTLITDLTHALGAPPNCERRTSGFATVLHPSTGAVLGVSSTSPQAMARAWLTVCLEPTQRALVERLALAEASGMSWGALADAALACERRGIAGDRLTLALFAVRIARGDKP